MSAEPARKPPEPPRALFAAAVQQRVLLHELRTELRGLRDDMMHEDRPPPDGQEAHHGTG